MKRLFFLLPILVLAACQPGSKETLKLGYIGPLTGDAAFISGDTLNAMRMKVEEINAAGGVRGRQVEIVAEDGRCAGTDSASAAQKLVNVDKVEGIVGGQCSSETLAAAPIAEAGKVLLVSPVSSSPDVTTAGAYVFRTYPSDDLKGKAFANYFTAKGYKKVALISENTDFCQGIRASIGKYLPEGVEIVFDEMVDPGTKDYRTLITRLKDTDFDVFIVNVQSDTTGSALLTQLRELGITQPAVGTDTTDSQTMFELASGALDNFFVVSVPVLDATSDFAETFTSKYGKPTFGLVYAAHAYDATSVLLNALSLADDNLSAVDALKGLENYQGKSGTFSFDANGDAQGFSFALKEFKDGVIAEVERISLD